MYTRLPCLWVLTEVRRPSLSMQYDSLGLGSALCVSEEDELGTKHVILSSALDCGCHVTSCLKSLPDFPTRMDCSHLDL